MCTQHKVSSEHVWDSIFLRSHLVSLWNDSSSCMLPAHQGNPSVHSCCWCNYKEQLIDAIMLLGTQGELGGHPDFTLSQEESGHQYDFFSDRHPKNVAKDGAGQGGALGLLFPACPLTLWCCGSVARAGRSWVSQLVSFARIHIYFLYSNNLLLQN